MNNDIGLEQLEDVFEHWLPRDILKCINQLNQVDALHNYNMREMSIMWDVASRFLLYTKKLFVWAYSILTLMVNTTDAVFGRHCKRIFDIIMQMTQLMW